MLLEGRWGRQAPRQHTGCHGGDFLLWEMDEQRGRCSVGLPSKDKLPGSGLGQEPAGFYTPREGCAGPVGQIAAPEVTAGPVMHSGKKPP